MGKQRDKVFSRDRKCFFECELLFSAGGICAAFAAFKNAAGASCFALRRYAHAISHLTGKTIESLIPGRGDWLVATIVQLERAKWLNREVDKDIASHVAAFTQMCRIVRLDAIVYATACECGAERLTADTRFDNLPGVSFVKKAKA